MKFLSINTSTSLCSVSIYENNKFKTLEKKDVRDHSKYLAVYSKELLKNNHNEIDFIAVSVGPGSYAGIRASLSFVKGLCMAMNKPIVPVENFESMNEKIRCNDSYYLCIYSHKDYVYSQLFKDNKKVSDSVCVKFNKLEQLRIYGYGLDSLSSNYKEIIPNSVLTGLYAKNNYKKLIENDFNKISPIYLEI
tara:strand:- start:66 stop:641 length:576 start_codon:yes stop_codon:yes gene_type:complete